MKRKNLRKTLLFTIFLSFPLSFMFMSPVLMVFGSYEGYIVSGLAFWFLVFATSFIFGRSFCSWVCPLGGEQMCLAECQQHRLIKIPFIRILKYIISAFWIGITIFFAIKAGGYKAIALGRYVEISKLDIQGLSVMLMITGGVFLVSLILGKRAFCHYLCPFSPLVITGARIKSFLPYPSLCLLADKNKCTGCAACNKVCPMSLDVSTMAVLRKTENSECILCGNCVDTCPNKVLSLEWK